MKTWQKLAASLAATAPLLTGLASARAENRQTATFGSVTSVAVRDGGITLKVGANLPIGCNNTPAVEAVFAAQPSDERAKLILQLALSSLHTKKRVAITFTGACKGAYAEIAEIELLQ